MNRVERLWQELAAILRLTNLEVTLLEMNSETDEFATERSARGKNDPGAFNVHVNVNVPESMNDQQVISSLFHEWLHMALFDAWEAGQAGRYKTTRDAYTQAHEAGVHSIERIVGPLVIRMWKRRKNGKNHNGRLQPDK